MRPTIPALLLGSTLVFQISPAAAGTVSWSDPSTRELNITWSSASPEALKSTLAGQKVEISADGSSEKLTGPGGGVLLLQVDGFSVEVDPDSGLVEAVRKDDDGTVVRRTLFDAFAAGGSVFKKDGSTQVMVTASQCAAPAAEGLLSSGADTRKPTLQFDVTIYDASGKTVEIIDQVSLAYDVRTLQPSVSWQKVRDYSSNYWSVSDYTWYTPYR